MRETFLFNHIKPEGVFFTLPHFLIFLESYRAETFHRASDTYNLS